MHVVLVGGWTHDARWLTPLSLSLSLSPLPLLQSAGGTGNQSYLSSFSKTLQTDHWPALPSPAPPSSSVAPLVQVTTSKTVNWGSGGGKANEQGQQPVKGEEEKAEEDLQHLMKSLDIAEHLHLLKVHMTLLLFLESF